MFVAYFVEGSCTGSYDAASLVHTETDGAIYMELQQGFTGRGYVDFVEFSDEELTWRLNSCNPGMHTLTFRYANGADTARSMRLIVTAGVEESVVGDDLQRYRGLNMQELEFEATGGWDIWSELAVNVTFGLGSNTLGIQSIGEIGANFDRVDVARACLSYPCLESRKASRLQEVL